jgi:hypothetical protein
MKTPFILLLLTLSAPLVALTPPGEPDNPAARIKSAIDRDWVAKPGDFGSVLVASPSYAMPFNQGCVIHQLAFLSVNGKASLGEMVSTDQYFVFAAGDACATVDPEQFFSIEPGNDIPALLDFARTLKSGPRPGKDKVSKADYARIAPCFAPAATALPRIMGGHSWREKGTSRDDRYQFTLRCTAVDDAGEIVVLGFRGQETITWTFKPWGEVMMDVPAVVEGQK